MTEEEILAQGRLVSGPGFTPSASPSSALTEADILSQGQLVSAGGPSGPKQAAPRRSMGEELKRQAGLTARMGIEGLGSALDIGTAPIAAVLNTITRSDYFKPSSAAAARLTQALNLPTPENSTERIVNKVGQRAAETLLPLGVAKQVANTATGVTREVAKQIAASPVATTAATTTGAATGQVARELGLSEPVATAIDIGASIGGQALGSRLSNAVAGRYTPEGQKAIDVNAAAKREGVTLSAGDLGSRTAQRIENITQDIPFSGRDAIMQKTANQIKGALTKLEKDVDLGQPTGKVMIDALRGQYQNVKNVAAAKYSDVSAELAKVPGTERVPLSNFQAEAQKFLKEFPRYLDRDDVPTSVKNMLNVAANPQIAGGVNVRLNPTYENARNVSKAVGQALSAARRQQATSGSEAMSGALEKVYGAIKTDFDGWATQIANTNPGAARAFADADAFFKQAVLPFRSNTTIYKAVAKGASDDDLAQMSDKIMKSLLRPDAPETAGLATRLAGPQGQRAAESELVQRALSSGLDDRLRAGVSPARFMNTLNLQDPMTQRILQGNTALAERLQNLSNISQAGRASTEAFSNPRTGVTMKGVGTAVGLLNPMTTVPTAATLGAANLANRALTTDAAKSLMFARGAQPLNYTLPAYTGLLNLIGQ
jgi:hypothetical protein